jgi:outer membrane protein TolC
MTARMRAICSPITRRFFDRRIPRPRRRDLIDPRRDHPERRRQLVRDPQRQRGQRRHPIGARELLVALALEPLVRHRRREAQLARVLLERDERESGRDGAHEAEADDGAPALVPDVVALAPDRGHHRQAHRPARPASLDGGDARDGRPARQPEVRRLVACEHHRAPPRRHRAVDGGGGEDAPVGGAVPGLAREAEQHEQLALALESARVLEELPDRGRALRREPHRGVARQRQRQQPVVVRHALDDERGLALHVDEHERRRRREDERRPGVQPAPSPREGLERSFGHRQRLTTGSSIALVVAPPRAEMLENLPSRLEEIQPSPPASPTVRGVAVGSAVAGGAGMRAPVAPLLVVLVAASPPPARADEQPQAMTLDEALAYARAHQPSLATARARLAAAAADVGVAKAAWLPSVGALAEIVVATTNNSTTTLIGDGAVTLPRIGATPIKPDLDWTPHASTVLAVGLRQQIYDFGRISAQKAAAQALEAIERERERGAGLDVEYAVVSAYYAVLGARGVLDVAEAARRRAQVNHDYITQAVKSGMRPPIDLTRAAAELERAEVGRIRARAGLRIARSVLAAAIGSPCLEIDAVPTVATQLPALAPPLASAQATADLALSMSPIVRELMAVVRAQEAQTKIQKTLLRPSLYLSAAFSARAGGAAPSSGPVPYGDGWLPVIPNYDAGLVLSWPVWDPVVWARKRASETREAVARAQLEAARIAVAHQAEQARQQLLVAAESIPALERAEAAARANHAQAETRLRAGLGTITELADAEAVLLDAQLGLVSGRYQLLTARAALARLLADSEAR